MSEAYLDKNGLTYFWSKIKNRFGFIDESPYYQATGSSGTLSLANGTITQIPLVSTGAISGGENIFSISDGEIKVSKAGNYRITGSVYVYGVNAVNICGCYIKKGTSFATSSEIFNANIGKDIAGAPQFGVTTGSKIVTLSANDIIYLCARVQGGTGTAYKDNKSTYLLVSAVDGGMSIETNTNTAEMGLRKIGNVVELRFYDKSITEVNSYTLPAAYRPTQQLSFPIVVWYSSKFYQGFLVIKTDGTITASYYNYGTAASTPASGSTIFGTCTYFLG